MNNFLKKYRTIKVKIYLKWKGLIIYMMFTAKRNVISPMKVKLREIENLRAEIRTGNKRPDIFYWVSLKSNNLKKILVNNRIIKV